MPAELPACRPISAIDMANWSLADAAAVTPTCVSFMSRATCSTKPMMRVAPPAMSLEVACSSRAACATLPTASPTPPWKLSTSRRSTAFCSARALRCNSASASALSRNTASARAMAPISSSRPVAGMVIDRSPSASRVIAPVISEREPETWRDNPRAPATTSAMHPAIIVSASLIAHVPSVSSACCAASACSRSAVSISAAWMASWLPDMSIALASASPVGEGPCASIDACSARSSGSNPSTCVTSHSICSRDWLPPPSSAIVASISLRAWSSVARAEVIICGSPPAA